MPKMLGKAGWAELWRDPVGGKLYTRHAAMNIVRSRSNTARRLNVAPQEAMKQKSAEGQTSQAAERKNETVSEAHFKAQIGTPIPIPSMFKGCKPQRFADSYLIGLLERGLIRIWVDGRVHFEFNESHPRYGELINSAELSD